MKRLTFIILSALLSFTSFSQTDTLAIEKDSTESKFFGEVYLTTKNLWRGVDFGNGSPSAQGLIVYNPFGGLEIGAFGATTLSGTTVGYGNTMNFFIGYNWKGISLTIDDYYFQGDGTNLPTSYWDWQNTHFLEARLSYKHDRFSVMAGYTLVGGDFYSDPVIDTLGTVLKNRNAIYFEASYNVTEEFSIFAGGITGPSALNFHDKAGITNIGFTYIREVELSDKFTLPIEAKVMVNPNFDNISPAGLPRVGYGTSRVNFAITFII